MFDDGIPITRRSALFLFAATIFGAGVRPAAAKDDDDGGSGSSGGGNSGNGGGDDSDNDSDNDSESDSDSDSDDGGDNSGSGRSGSVRRSDDDDDDRIRAAVRGGEAAPLREILAVVRKSYRGKIVNIRLTGSGSRLAYRIRMLDSVNRLIELRVNAKTRKITSVRKL